MFYRSFVQNRTWNILTPAMTTWNVPVFGFDNPSHVEVFTGSDTFHSQCPCVVSLQTLHVINTHLWCGAGGLKGKGLGRGKVCVWEGL